MKATIKLYLVMTLITTCLDLWLFSESKIPKYPPASEKYASWRPGYGFHTWLEYGLKGDR